MLATSAVGGTSGRVLRLQGEIDLATHDILDSAIAELVSAAGDIRIDMSEVDFIDVGGLRILNVAARSIRDADRAVTVVGLDPMTRRVLRLLSWTDLLASAS
ncbi:hypothetical protein Abr02nite_73860 [Paractinoplanes brasiliensis]|nr:hypothetical protein Abr02nite_73860 [Actinoplanes brasiliensis]